MVTCIHAIAEVKRYKNREENPGTEEGGYRSDRDVIKYRNKYEHMGYGGWAMIANTNRPPDVVLETRTQAGLVVIESKEN